MVRRNVSRGAKPSECRTRARVDVNTWVCMAETARQGINSRLSLHSTAHLQGLRVCSATARDGLG